MSGPKGLVTPPPVPTALPACLMKPDAGSEEGKAHHERQETYPDEPSRLRLCRGDFAEEILAHLHVGVMLVSPNVVDYSAVLLVDMVLR